MLRAIVSFFSNFTATLLALFVFFFILPIALLVAIGVSSTQNIDDASASSDFSTLVINLSDPIEESSKAQNSFVDYVNGETILTPRSICARINKASGDSSNKAIFICGSFEGLVSALSYAQISELRKALESYVKSGKSVIAYLENPSMRDYYLVSCATKIYLNPFGSLDFKGLGGNSVFFGNALEKYGIDATVVKVGKLKSFGEMFTSDKMSEPVRENYTQLLNSIWGTIVEKISKSRKVSVDKLKSIASEKAMLTSKESLEFKLVDKLAYKDEVIAEMQKLVGKQKFTFAQASIIDYPEDVIVNPPSKIAVIYMNGDIVETATRPDAIDSTTYCKLIRSIRNSTEYSGAVVRINSGGGSAYASELIRRELELLAKKMPVVISIGGATASGGYWIATAGKEIVADAESITGSIGVFALMFSAQKFAGDFGITFDCVKTAPMADIGTISRSPSTLEIERMQKHIDDVYEKFVELVAKSRKLPREKVLTFADGRVFSGAMAKELKLVDSIGGLEYAIDRVKKLGAMKNSAIDELPKRDAFVEFVEKLAPVVGGEFAKSKFIKSIIETAEKTKELKSGAYARVPFDFQIK